MNESMIRHPRICDHCGGRFGMVTHRWWGIKFCKKTCKDAYLRELAGGGGEEGFVRGGVASFMDFCRRVEVCRGGAAGLRYFDSGARPR